MPTIKESKKLESSMIVDRHGNCLMLLQRYTVAAFFFIVGQRSNFSWYNFSPELFQSSKIQESAKLYKLYQQFNGDIP